MSISESEKIFLEKMKRKQKELQNAIEARREASLPLNPRDFNDYGDLTQLLAIIEREERKTASLEAQLEAEKAVKDRFKELYVSAVVKKALNDEGVDI